MAAGNFFIKQGDLLPILSATLTDSSGVAIDLTGATVKFLMRLPGATTAKINAVATVVNAFAGMVQYGWAGTDTDTPGGYVAEWLVSYSGPKPMTVPNLGFISVNVSQNLQ